MQRLAYGLIICWMSLMFLELLDQTSVWQRYYVSFLPKPNLCKVPSISQYFWFFHCFFGRPLGSNFTIHKTSFWQIIFHHKLYVYLQLKMIKSCVSLFGTQMVILSPNLFTFSSGNWICSEVVERWTEWGDNKLGQKTSELSGSKGGDHGYTVQWQPHTCRFP